MDLEDNPPARALVLGFLGVPAALEVGKVSRQCHLLYGPGYVWRHLRLTPGRGLYEDSHPDCTLRQWALLPDVVRKTVASTVRTLTLDLYLNSVQSLDVSCGQDFVSLEKLILCIDVTIMDRDANARGKGTQGHVPGSDLMHLGALLVSFMPRLPILHLHTRGHSVVQQEFLNLTCRLGTRLRELRLLIHNDSDFQLQHVPTSTLAVLESFASGEGAFNDPDMLHNLVGIRRLSGRFVLNSSGSCFGAYPPGGCPARLREILDALSIHCASLTTLGLSLDTGCLLSIVDVLARCCPETLHFLILFLDVSPMSRGDQNRFTTLLRDAMRNYHRCPGLQLLTFTKFVHTQQNWINFDIPFGPIRTGWDSFVDDAMLAGLCSMDELLKQNNLFIEVVENATWNII